VEIDGRAHQRSAIVVALQYDSMEARGPLRRTIALVAQRSFSSIDSVTMELSRHADRIRG
jgi:hypothetical protein